MTAKHLLDQIVRGLDGVTADRLCSIPECGEKHKSKGYCPKHYKRLRLHGDPLGGGMSPKEPERFFEEVVLQYDGDDCLIWPYTRNRWGYGRIQRNGKRSEAHRTVCEEVKGPPTTPKHEAAHSCGNGHLGCVTKGHLSWKTHAENMADMIAHRTQRRGERHPCAKITEAQAREIIALRGKEMSPVIASRYSISTTTVSAIQLGRKWAWLQEGEAR